jgi:hypothetical protein
VLLCVGIFGVWCLLLADTLKSATGVMGVVIALASLISLASGVVITLVVLQRTQLDSAAMVIVAMVMAPLFSMAMFLLMLLVTVVLRALGGTLVRWRDAEGERRQQSLAARKERWERRKELWRTVKKAWRTGEMR